MPSKHAGKPVTIRLDPADFVRWEALKGQHGGAKAAFLAGISALEGRNDIDLPAALERAAAELRSQAKRESSVVSTKAVDIPLSGLTVGDVSTVPMPPAPAPILHAITPSAAPADDGKARGAARFARKPAPE